MIVYGQQCFKSFFLFSLLLLFSPFPFLSIVAFSFFFFSSLSPHTLLLSFFISFFFFLHRHDFLPRCSGLLLLLFFFFFLRYEPPSSPFPFAASPLSPLSSTVTPFLLSRTLSRPPFASMSIFCLFFRSVFCFLVEEVLVYWFFLERECVRVVYFKE